MDAEYLIDVEDGSFTVIISYHREKIGEFHAPVCPDELTTEDAKAIASRIAELSLFLRYYERSCEDE